MNNFTTSRKEVNACPKMTDREKFVYIFTSLVLNPVVMGLDRKRKDEILMDMKNKFCPKVTNADWYVLFHETETLRVPLTNELNKITTPQKQQNIMANFMSVVGDVNYKDIVDLANKVQQKMKG